MFATSAEKLKNVNLPSIDAALGPMEFSWQFSRYPETPELTGLINYQNFDVEQAQDALLAVLARAYRLADGWKIHGLAGLAQGNLEHIHGGWKSGQASRYAPALESTMFEMQSGQITGISKDGGWKVAGVAGGDEKEGPT